LLGADSAAHGQGGRVSVKGTNDPDHEIDRACAQTMGNLRAGRKSL